jgi:hypothetical protein
LRETVGRSSRNILRLSALLISVVIATAAFSGCGDASDSGSTARSPDQSDAVAEAAGDVKRYIARAEPICRQSIGEIEQLAASFSQVAAGSGSFGGTIANGLVRPGIAILERKAARLRAIQSAPQSADLHAYLGLFDPIVELSRQLLQASEANDASRSHELELMIAGLGHEQSTAGRNFGFKGCAVGFTEALGGTG